MTLHHCVSHGLLTLFLHLFPISSDVGQHAGRVPVWTFICQAPGPLFGASRRAVHPDSWFAVLLPGGGLWAGWLVLQARP